MDLALWGHHHSYQRTCPVYKEECTEGATTHLVIGNGGQHLSKPFRQVRIVDCHEVLMKLFGIGKQFGDL